MGTTKIEWAEAVWNPVTGCTKVSPGCQHCYAERMAKRLAGRCGYQKDKPFQVTLHPEKRDEPLHWKKPRTVFVCSMGDLFHADVPFEFVDRVFAVMASSSQHTFLVLTKRPERMAGWFKRVSEQGPIHQNLYTSSLIDFYQRHNVDLTKPYQVPTPPTAELRFIYDSADGVDPYASIEDRPYNEPRGDCHWRGWPLGNVWLGTSVENQATADERIPWLLKVPAAVRFLSCEPLLGSVDLYQAGAWDIDWVIAGGESGPNARPMHPDWARSIRDQCQAAGVPFFFKQWGEWSPHNSLVPIGGRDTPRAMAAEGTDSELVVYRVGRKAAGRLLDGREWSEMPHGERQG